MTEKTKNRLCCLLPAVAALLLFALNLMVGAVEIPLAALADILCGGDGGNSGWQFIVWESRLPQAVTALLAGMSLAAAGLMLQTSFRNPLAGPEVLGINSGAGLGVAVAMLLFHGQMQMQGTTFGGFALILFSAMLGGMAVMALILFFSTFLRSNVMLLIIGLAVSYLTSSFVSLLNYFSTAEGVHSYMIWGMGNFGGVSLARLPFFSGTVAVGLGIALLLVKPLNALLLGDIYAANLGVNVRRIRWLLLLSTGLLTAVCTAYCGPISFIGLAVPHIARLLTGSGNHRLLLPATLFAGAAVSLLCNLLSQLPTGGGLIPLNALTPLIGAPVIVFVVISKRNTLS